MSTAAESLAIASSIPFNRPSLIGNEMEYVHDAIARGHLSGDGVYSRRCEAVLSQLLNDARVLLTTSCTHALEMAALLLDIRPGDEVIVPSFTFVSTANAFVLRGARPVFADIRPDTLNLDERLLAEAITERTRAIVPVHYAGVGCAMDAIVRIAQRAGAEVVEDNAHGLFGTYDSRPLGTFGAMSALSFHETKNVFCGEGGALAINDPRFAARAEVLREKGTDRSRFFRGEVDKYTWLDVGSSYVPSDLLAAFLLAQLERHERIQAERQRLWLRYRNALAEWAAARGAELPHVPERCGSSHHLFRILMPSLGERQALIAHLRRRHIQAIFHYLPLHLSPMGAQFGGRPGQCPVAESVSERIVRLPLFTTLTADEQTRVIDAVLDF
ncbi:MAG: dTDP-4-amino-4,6-dideoxygalactose transaminase [Acidobacteria bacterium]|nr:dTDP-4-amino-4,6-dideoxygalactose transaminase [Acidobacteriota bacterium]MBV9476219.1 dTDP-4-amino-4,6-dideoxygalactose transaminase [Acidobacteriota bacterium]